jgi:hypothetical protein
MRKLYVPVGFLFIKQCFSAAVEDGSLNEHKANQNIAWKSESE